MPPEVLAPAVSVCIPAFNAGPYLAAAIDSALAQSLGDIEIVVSDDASTDGTREVCVAYEDERLRYVRSDQRLGQSGNWNRCVELARGKYVILLHADDELLPNYLERAAAILDAHPDVGLVHCSAQHIDERGNPLTLQRLFDHDLIDRDDAILRRLLIDGCVISPAGVLVRRDIFDAVGRFTDRIVWGVDWHMWIRIALRSPVAFITEPLARYRQHGQSGTSGVMKSGRNARDETWAVNDLFDLIARTRPELSDLRTAAVHGVAHRTWCFAEMMCQAGDTAGARTGLRNAVRIWPGMIRQSRVWGLWMATYLGYPWFTALHEGKQKLATRLGRGPSPAG